MSFLLDQMEEKTTVRMIKSSIDVMQYLVEESKELMLTCVVWTD